MILCCVPLSSVIGTTPASMSKAAAPSIAAVANQHL